MTAQFGENLRYDGREMSMATHPLGDYFALGGVNPGFGQDWPMDCTALVRELFISAGDIEPDEASNTLIVRIHRMVTPAHDKAIAALLEDLNALGFCHPETGQKMIYALV